MANPRHTSLLLILLPVMVMMGPATGWAQRIDRQSPAVRSLVVTEPALSGIAVDKTFLRKTAEQRPESAVPRRLPPVNDLSTPHSMLPHRLLGRYSIRLQTEADRELIQKPLPAIEPTELAEPEAELELFPASLGRTLPPSQRSASGEGRPASSRFNIRDAERIIQEPIDPLSSRASIRSDWKPYPVPAATARRDVVLQLK